MHLAENVRHSLDVFWRKLEEVLQVSVVSHFRPCIDNAFVKEDVLVAHKLKENLVVENRAETLTMLLLQQSTDAVCVST